MLLQAQRGANFIADIHSQPGIRRRRSSKLRPLYARERPSTHCTGHLVGLGTSLDSMERLIPPGFDPPTVQPTASRYTDCAIPPFEDKCITVRAQYAIGESRPYLGVPGPYSQPKEHLSSACVVFPRQPKQFCYRKQISNKNDSFYLIDCEFKYINHTVHTCRISHDLAKALDCANHKILLPKLILFCGIQ
jgi:hypothetical protein